MIWISCWTLIKKKKKKKREQKKIVEKSKNLIFGGDIGVESQHWRGCEN
jgi:hypothetical protein